MQFKPNMDLYVEWENASKIFENGHLSYIAVFKKNKKTLIYLADDHGKNISFDMVDFCFSKQSPVAPEIVVIEREEDWKPSLGRIHEQSLSYAAAIAAKRGLPIVFADLSGEDMLKVLKEYTPDKSLTEDDLHKTLSSGGPSRKKGSYNLLSAELNLHGRDPFMLKNIAAALNKYDTVFAMFGEGHYRSQRLILEDMMGKPEYITKVPNTRGDFNGVEIVPIKLVDNRSKSKSLKHAGGLVNKWSKVAKKGGKNEQNTK